MWNKSWLLSLSDPCAYYYYSPYSIRPPVHWQKWDAKQTRFPNSIRQGWIKNSLSSSQWLIHTPSGWSGEALVVRVDKSALEFFASIMNTTRPPFKTALFVGIKHCNHTQLSCGYNSEDKSSYSLWTSLYCLLISVSSSAQVEYMLLLPAVFLFLRRMLYPYTAAAREYYLNLSGAIATGHGSCRRR